jgi:hypothetical protein
MSAMARETRRVVALLAELERRGCQVLGARVLPVPAVRVDRAPAGIDTWGRVQAPPGVSCYVAEHVAHLRGVRITWEART